MTGGAPRSRHSRAYGTLLRDDGAGGWAIARSSADAAAEATGDAAGILAGMPPPIRRPRVASRRRLAASLATFPTLAGCLGLTDPPLLE